MRALVTGGGGFLGSHLADYLLDQGNKVTVLDNLIGGLRSNVPKKATFVNGDVADEKAVDKAIKGVDIVYHLAADAREGLSFFKPTGIARTNYLGSVHLLRAAINQGVDRFVFTSSMARYGIQPKLPFVESMDPKPIDPYGLSKLSFERLLEIYRKAFGTEYCVLIPHNIYGPRQCMTDPYRNVLAIFMNRTMMGKPPLIYGDGKQVRDFSYYSDCVPVIERAGVDKGARNNFFNIGPDEDPVTLNEVADIIIGITGYKGKAQHIPARHGEVKFAWCSSKKARRVLGYRTTVHLHEGLERMWKWAKAGGARPWKYEDRLEIENEFTPPVWKKKLM